MPQCSSVNIFRVLVSAKLRGSEPSTGQCQVEQFIAAHVLQPVP